MNQRWLDRIGSFRSPEEIINTRAYEIAEIPGDKPARAFVERHHYSATYPAARERFGLYQSATGALVGVAVFSHPPSEKVLARLPCERLAGVELGRFVLLDSVAGNGESWFLARCFDAMRAKGYAAIISHSDPLPRQTADGRVTLAGHVGNVYQATNAVYAGRTKPTKLALFADGTVFSARSMSKIRKRESGYRRCIAELVDRGAPAPSSDLMSAADLTAWMWTAIGATCRRVSHRGNHRYLWALDKHLRRNVAALAVNAPYPKTLDMAALALPMAA